MTSDEHTQPDIHRLTADEVGARVGAILGAAEREAREIITAARRETPAPVESGATIDDLVHALERLGARLDAFELATAARIEELARQLRGSAAAGSAAPAEPSVAAPPPVEAEPEDSAAQDAARVRAIDLALAGYSREAIANELAVSMTRGDVETLLDQVLVG
jgi:hypothetical protein